MIHCFWSKLVAEIMPSHTLRRGALNYPKVQGGYGPCKQRFSAGGECHRLDRLNSALSHITQLSSCLDSNLLSKEDSSFGDLPFHGTLESLVQVMEALSLWSD